MVPLIRRSSVTGLCWKVSGQGVVREPVGVRGIAHHARLLQQVRLPAAHEVER
jgi:hypothetical protein